MTEVKRQPPNNTALLFSIAVNIALAGVIAYTWMSPDAPPATGDGRPGEPRPTTAEHAATDVPPRPSTSRRSGNASEVPNPGENCAYLERDLASCMSELAELSAPPRYNLNQKQLDDLARKCEFYTDTPGTLRTEHIEALEISESELTGYKKALERYQAWKSDETRKVMATVGPKWASADPSSILDALRAADSEGAHDDAISVRRYVSQMRAGWEVDPVKVDELHPSAQWAFLQSQLGDQFERELAAELGWDRARQLRTGLDGWPGGGIRHNDGCE